MIDAKPTIELYFHSVQTAADSWSTAVQKIPDYERVFGTILFHEIFDLDPGALDLFGFREVVVSDGAGGGTFSPSFGSSEKLSTTRTPSVPKGLFATPQFQAHSKLFVRSLEKVLIALQAGKYRDVARSLQQLSARHFAFGIVPAHFSMMETALLRALEFVLGESNFNNGKLRQSWAAVLKFIAAAMQAGVHSQIQITSSNMMLGNNNHDHDDSDTYTEQSEVILTMDFSKALPRSGSDSELLVVRKQGGAVQRSGSDSSVQLLFDAIKQGRDGGKSAIKNKTPVKNNVFSQICDFTLGLASAPVEHRPVSRWHDAAAAAAAAACSVIDSDIEEEQELSQDDDSDYGVDILSCSKDDASNSSTSETAEDHLSGEDADSDTSISLMSFGDGQDGASSSIYEDVMIPLKQSSRLSSSLNDLDYDDTEGSEERFSASFGDLASCSVHSTDLPPTKPVRVFSPRAKKEKLRKPPTVSKSTGDLPIATGLPLFLMARQKRRKSKSFNEDKSLVDNSQLRTFSESMEDLLAGKSIVV